MTKHNKLQYHSWHRGTKELDLILGGYADSILEHMSDLDLDLYERFLKEDDYDIYAWIMGWETPLEKYQMLVKSIQSTLSNSADSPA
ncbi:MAG: succinate dehydrogenase assembly factor 2 [Alphaproteobacteria bacterium]|nr:succinate dehydrogenase assembly factor 2 [Alphaproteobacteria bacterium]